MDTTRDTEMMLEVQATALLLIDAINDFQFPEARRWNHSPWRWRARWLN